MPSSRNASADLSQADRLRFVPIRNPDCDCTDGPALDPARRMSGCIGYPHSSPKQRAVGAKLHLEFFDGSYRYFISGLRSNDLLSNAGDPSGRRRSRRSVRIKGYARKQFSFIEALVVRGAKISGLGSSRNATALPTTTLPISLRTKPMRMSSKLSSF
jgi:hypothetical protein